jgi:hypothetical protein
MFEIIFDKVNTQHFNYEAATLLLKEWCHGVVFTHFLYTLGMDLINWSLASLSRLVCCYNLAREPLLKVQTQYG